MNRRIVATICCFAIAPALLAQKKEAERLQNSAKVLQEIMSTEKGLNKEILHQARCVLIYPGVKKVAVGFGSSYGRGALVCREGEGMKGKWGAPVMYSLDQQSLGIQLGSTATDFVLVVMRQKGVDQILNGKAKLGSDAVAAAGPSGAEAGAFNAEAMNVDVLTYSRSKGLFAGVSLSGASIETDNDANKALYGKEIGPSEIVKGNTPIVPAAKPLIDLLDKYSPTGK
jgi:lipid-binding SYLF domain-containing protein